MVAARSDTYATSVTEDGVLGRNPVLIGEAALARSSLSRRRECLSVVIDDWWPNRTAISSSAFFAKKRVLP